MKKFAVLQKIGRFSASVVREFDAYNDAVQFAVLMRRSEDNDSVSYNVVENIELKDAV